MSFIVSHLVSGNAFFSGVIFILVAVLLSTLRYRFVGIATNLLAAFGMTFVALSATPLPFWFYALWGIVMVAWLIGQNFRNVCSKWTPASCVLATGLTFAATAWELPYHWPPHLPQRSNSGFSLLGDSISAGIGNNDIVCWPKLIQQDHHVDVINLSSPGESVQSCLTRAARISSTDNLVLLEIGGNDVLAKTPLQEFERSLDNLLQIVCRPGRIVVMLELPLPPFCNGYGLVQRRLARRFGVVLIPRRFFADVLSSEQTTLDGLHLSQRGHERMADMIWSFLRPSLATRS